MGILSILPWVVSGAGAIWLLRLRGFFLLHPVQTRRVLRAGVGQTRREAVHALLLALAGTLGVGNITGVALGLMVGGAGSVFWMIVSALFAAVLKYVETTASLLLCKREQVQDPKQTVCAGIALVIRRTGPFGKTGETVWCLAALGLSLSMGAALQCRAAVETMTRIGAIPALPVGIGMLVAAFFLTRGGGKRIERITSLILPIACIMYIILCIYTIIFFRERLGSAIASVFYEAFTVKGGVGGVLGFFCNRTVREGFCRGMLSNEAGAGTSTLAHVRNREADPCAQGIFGMLEVVADTLILCPLTALALLCGVPSIPRGGSPAEYVCRAFCGAMGRMYRVPLGFCVGVFALATVICWYYYGTQMWRYLCGTRCRYGFGILFFSSLFFGGIWGGNFLFAVSDVLLFLLTAVCVPTLLTWRAQDLSFPLARK